VLRLSVNFGKMMLPKSPVESNEREGT
jgi:hypothetical protein